MHFHFPSRRVVGNGLPTYYAPFGGVLSNWQAPR